MNKNMRVAKQLIVLAKQLLSTQNEEKTAKKIQAGWTTIYGYDDVDYKIFETLKQIKGKLAALKTDDGKRIYGARDLSLFINKDKYDDTTKGYKLYAFANKKLPENFKEKYKDITFSVTITTDQYNTTLYSKIESNLDKDFPHLAKGFKLKEFIGNDNKENSLQPGTGGKKLIDAFEKQMWIFSQYMADKKFE